MKILVVGFPRSGTTLTYRIFKEHPHIQQMFFEKWMLKQAKDKKQLIKKYPSFENNCGEKVIWAKRIIGKKGKTTDSIVDYCLKWNKWFGDEARIIQIVRHPIDSLNSLVISKKRLPRGPAFQTNYKEYMEYMPIFSQEIAQIPNCLTIKYENLVSDFNNMCKLLYEHTGLSTKHKHKETIKTGRIFNYKQKDLLFEYDTKLENSIHALNKITGIHYDVLGS